ncbi:MAG TPA: M1 family aminopeptidase [Rhodocyclaceae bacterium]|nr:M1 family aminopeptidase [Rhodocyclaceae bacterium]
MTRFEFPHPGEGIDLIAGPYRVAERPVTSHDGRELLLRTYFHDDIAALADAYLDATAAYLALYEDWIGPYPYTGFSVVSSPTPTGFGMPTLTYLGIDVLRLPFIRDTSLGHEVLHNWWGNGVYPDYSQGNWAEGLTTFMADYTYAQRRDAQAARAMRLAWLRELSGIPAGADAPLAAFTARHHGVSQAVGYGKAAMLFVMLRERIGTAAFDDGVRRFWRAQRFRVAGWDALRTAFEAASGEELEAFFTQWLTRSGLPEVGLEAAVATPAGVHVTLSQAAPAYALDVPLEVDTGDRRERLVVRLESLRQDFELRIDGAQRVRLDPEHLLLRRLGRGEAPPILRELLFDRGTAVVTLGGPGLAAATDALLARLFDHRPGRRPAGEPPASTPLLVIGADDEVARWLARHRLPPPPTEAAGRGDVRMWTLRLPSGTALALIAARDAAALERALRPLPHYGQQSWLVIDDGRAVARGVWPARVPTLTLTNDRVSGGPRRARGAQTDADGAASR